MNIRSAEKVYSVSIYDDFQAIENIKVSSDTFLVIDKTLYELYRDQLFRDLPEGQVYILEAAEENKVIQTALDICEIMTTIPAKRNARLISFGGGIIQDVTGFVANILYRGIHWTFYPTTLLAACDSCIGGKTSLNYKHYKNLLGTFYPPDEICICTPFFKTLTERKFKSGLGEVVKFNVMRGEDGIRNMEMYLQDLLCRDESVLRRFVESSLEFKKNFIEEDEYDRGIRVQLNFAHTYGHAFETVSGYEIPHGTAVAMGTIAADRVSLARGWMSEEKVSRIEKILFPIIKIDKNALYTKLDSILDAMHKDKKQTGKSLTAVLMQEIGDKMMLNVIHDLNSDEVRESVEYLMSHI